MMEKTIRVDFMQNTTNQLSNWSIKSYPKFLEPKYNHLIFEVNHLFIVAPANQMLSSLWLDFVHVGYISRDLSFGESDRALTAIFICKATRVICIFT